MRNCNKPYVMPDMIPTRRPYKEPRKEMKNILNNVIDPPKGKDAKEKKDVMQESAIHAAQQSKTRSGKAFCFEPFV